MITESPMGVLEMSIIFFVAVTSFTLVVLMIIAKGRINKHIKMSALELCGFSLGKGIFIGGLIISLTRRIAALFFVSFAMYAFYDWILWRINKK